MHDRTEERRTGVAAQGPRVAMPASVRTASGVHGGHPRRHAVRARAIAALCLLAALVAPAGPPAGAQSLGAQSLGAQSLGSGETAQLGQAPAPAGASAGQPADPFAADRALVDHLLDSTRSERPPEALVETLYDDPDAAARPMAMFLSDGEPSPEQRARRAVILARGIVDSRRAVAEPETRDRLIATLLEVASQVVCSTRFVRSEIAEGYVPRLSTFPYDFGSPASQVASGFTLATPLSAMFVGGRPLDREGLGTGALLFDGISGMDQIVLFVPNGRYILILLTAMGGEGEVFSVRINGVDHWVAWTPASEWPLGAPLVVPAAMTPASTPVGGSAGKLSLPVRVPDGMVTIDFEGLPTELPFASLELVLYDEDVGPDLDEEDCLKWDRAQREAILALLEEGGGTGDDPVIPPPTDGCIGGDCPIEDPVDPSPSGAT